MFPQNEIRDYDAPEFGGVQADCLPDIPIEGRRGNPQREIGVLIGFAECVEIPCFQYVVACIYIKIHITLEVIFIAIPLGPTIENQFNLFIKW